MELRRLLDVDDGVDAESTDPLLHPPSDVLVYFLAQLRVFPVEVGLLFVEDVHIELIGARQLVPARPAKIGPPVGRKLPVRILVPQVEELAVLAVRIFTGLLKPLVLIRTVIDYKVHQDGHPALFCLRDQLFHVLHGPEARIDRIIVRDIISLVGQRRLIDRGDPHDVHSQLLQIVQPADDPLQIADAVAIAVHKALGVDLISYFVMPPFSLHSPMFSFSQRVQSVHQLPGSS